MNRNYLFNKIAVDMGGNMENLALEFYRGKKVFVTGHTGFKGSWLCKILLQTGAEVVGYALEPPTSPSLFELCGLDREMCCVTGNVRDFPKLCRAVREAQPDFIFHLAAQPLVRDSYAFPRLTYETNVMGTVNLLESVRELGGKQVSLVNVTTDKVYQNREWLWGYREDETLNGFDPYSNSKSCSELVSECYRNCFFQSQEIPISTVRAGNVIGGGDFSRDRIIPDCVRSVQEKHPVFVRNPNSIRPYQHVLDPLFAYLLIAQKQYETPQYADSYNVGPGEDGCVSTGELVSLFCRFWGQGASWQYQADLGPREADFLKLDCSKLKSRLCWRPHWDIQTAVEKTVEWTKEFLYSGNIVSCMERQMDDFQRTAQEKQKVVG